MGLVKSSCTGSCWGSCGTDNSTTGSCSGCGGTCHGCSGGCSDGCTTGCEGCSGCGSGCAGCSGCGGSCSTNCSGCNGCSGCGGECSSNCNGGCSGCSGCGAGCAGSCSGDCNNACNSTSAAQTIANLGSNIKLGTFISDTDILDLKAAAEAELRRRGKSNSISNYTVPVSKGAFAYVEHIQKYLTDCNNIKNAKNYSVTKGNTIIATSIEDSITYIKQLMQENIK